MKDVIELAKQAGIPTYKGMNGAEYLHVEGVEVTDEIEALIKLVRNAALEEAARKCVASELIDMPTRHEIATVRKCAKAIESLKEPTP